jgi:glycosyltransferase involved in cell wall biosynthesis
MPPCKNYTGGLVLDQLCSFLPKDSAACFAIVYPGAPGATLSEDLSWMPIKYCDKPREYWKLLPWKWSFLNKFLSFTMESYNSIFRTRKLEREIGKFGEKHDVTLLWCVLEGQTVIRLARPVAKLLNIPLFVEIWDPPPWWLKEHGVDAISQKRIIKEYEKALKASKGCYAASFAMARQYEEDYGIRTSLFLPSLDESYALPPAKTMHDDKSLIIGMAGVLYMLEEWEKLLSALDSVDWKIGGRDVKVRLLTREVNLRGFGKRDIEFLGFRPQEETIRLLSETDIQYCPYWFSPKYETEARLSFPSKLTTYFASGRPVFFHGPAYASPAKFIEEHETGILCHSLDPSEIIYSLLQIIDNPDLYAKLSQNGRNVFDKYFTLRSLRKSFADFLQIGEDFLNKA